jgi:hypothetical protein
MSPSPYRALSPDFVVRGDTSGYGVKVPGTMGCAETFCEGQMATMGKTYGNNSNLKVLDCIQRTALDQSGGATCFNTSDPAASAEQKALYSCTVCHGCVTVPPAEFNKTCPNMTMPAASSGWY